MPISALSFKKDVLLCFTFWLSLAKAKKLCLKEGNCTAPEMIPIPK